MKNIFKRISATLLVLFLVVSLLPGSVTAAPSSTKVTTTPTGYDEASDVVYVKSNVSGKQVIANWGARGEDCVFLSTYALNYYTGEYSFDTLSALSGGTSQSNAPSSTLYNELQDLMESTHSFYTYYDGNKNVRDYYKYTDCVSSNTSQVALLYRCVMVSSKWDSGNTWNQEHMWPQSKLANSKQIGDIAHLRPSNPSENSSRGNTAYGKSSGYYNPGPSVRGDCARTVLYMYVRWGITNKMWGSGGVIENVDVLLEWMAEDPVDTWEMGRNDSVQSITGNRNVFIDYPELAWLLFGKNVPAGITTPSDNDGITATPGGNTGNSGNSGNTGNNGGTTTTNPPATNPPATNPPATEPVATNPPATNPPATEPVATNPPATNPPATEPPASDPSSGGNNQTSTPATQAGPVAMATTPLDPNDFIPPQQNNNIVLFVCCLVVGLLIIAVIVYFFVIKPKKAAAPAEVMVEETPIVEGANEPTAEETTEDTTENNE